jgi:hypothetical protein
MYLQITDLIYTVTCSSFSYIIIHNFPKKRKLIVLVCSSNNTCIYYKNLYSFANFEASDHYHNYVYLKSYLF